MLNKGNINDYNISSSNKLNKELFFRCHDLIDTIEDNIKNFLGNKTNKFISTSAIIHPSAVIGNNVFIDDDVIIGPNCYIKSNSIILKGTKLGYSVEIDRCIIFDNVKISHSSCIGRCIIGKNSNLAYNFVIATKNLKGTSVKSYFKNIKHISSRKHHGALIGENLITGVNVSIMPGTTIEEDIVIKNHLTINGFLSANTILL